MTIDAALHGSPAGHEQGCRGRGACRFDESSEFLTCTEAAIARRADFALGRLPATQPIPRVLRSGAAPPSRTRVSEGTEEVHGTTWGYQRGCRDSRACPNWRRGKVTCAEARRRYISQYGTGRMRGRGTAVAHGTSNGYLLGCRDPRTCPGDDTGRSCSVARADYRRELARAAGIAPRSETISSEEAARRVRAWVESGISIRRIALLTGCGRTTIAELADEARCHRPRVSIATMQKILAVADHRPDDDDSSPAIASAQARPVAE